jgi:hypothetical protein
MFWYKAWLETRLRLWIALGWMSFLLLFAALRTVAPKPETNSVFGLSVMMGSFVTVMCAWFAGAGIASQGSFQFLKGLHGSTQYTLSLPVSRLRLLTIRATLGWLLMASMIGLFCCGVWLVAPSLTASATLFGIVEYAVTVVACASVFYFLSVLLATFLDDQWRCWGTMIPCVVVWGLPYVISVPGYTDIFRAMGEGSPLVSHAMPWSVMIFSSILAAAWFLAALKVAQSREY